MSTTMKSTSESHYCASMRVSRITAARLYNLGNYEHVRYELSVELSEGESAAKAMVAIEKVLGALGPRPFGVLSEDELEDQRELVDRLTTMSDECYRETYGRSYGISKNDRLKQEKMKLAKAIADRAAWVAKAQKARDLLDNLGAAVEWTDAKCDWEHDGR